MEGKKTSGLTVDTGEIEHMDETTKRATEAAIPARVPDPAPNG